jgi:hypothetical protein
MIMIVYGSHAFLWFEGLVLIEAIGKGVSVVLSNNVEGK